MLFIRNDILQNYGMIYIFQAEMNISFYSTGKWT